MRHPVVAGQFYPSDKDELISSIKSCFTHELGPGLPEKIGTERSIVGAIGPHAGYAASGMNVAHIYRKIAEDGLPDAYILIGPDHFGKISETVMCSEEYETPLGPCKIHTEIASRLREFIKDDVNGHSTEHSVEAHVPFIQFIDPDPHIVPILMGRQDPDSAMALAEALKVACKGFDVIFIASNDMAHYVSKSVCKDLDNMVLEKIINGDTDGMYDEVIGKNINLCGYGPIAAAMMAAEPKRFELLKHSDSWDSLGHDVNSVVGYASVAMYR